MRNIFLIAMIASILISCSSKDTHQNNKQETPKALQEGSSGKVFSKRESGDLVEQLYNELAGKISELKDIETSIDNLNESKSDSLALFNNYNDKNQSYYSSANNHVAQIKDSLLRERIKLLVFNSLSKYDSRIAIHNKLLDNINSKEASINDLHTVLKIVRTLPIIEKYQQDKFPSTKPLEGFNKEAGKTLSSLDSLVKK